MNRLEYTPFTGAYSISIDVSQANPGERIYLPDTPVLSDKFITAMTVFGISYSSSNVQDPDGNVISSNNVGQFFVTLLDLINDILFHVRRPANPDQPIPCTPELLSDETENRKHTAYPVDVLLHLYSRILVQKTGLFREIENTVG